VCITFATVQKRLQGWATGKHAERTLPSAEQAIFTLLRFLFKAKRLTQGQSRKCSQSSNIFVNGWTGFSDSGDECPSSPGQRTEYLTIALD